MIDAANDPLNDDGMLRRKGQFFGTRVRGVQGRDFSFHEYSYESRAAIPKHSHCMAIFSLLTRGHYTETVGRHTRNCSISDSIYHHPDEEHREQFGDTGGVIFGFEVPEPLLQMLAEDGLQTSESCEHLELIPRSLLWKIYNKFADQSRLSLFASEAYAMELLLSLPSKRKKMSQGHRVPRWLSQAKEILHESPTNIPRLTVVAATLGIHPSHLTRQFRRHVGCTMGEYVRRLRIEWAIRQLEETDLSISEIAASGGFSDQSHLNRDMKSLVGVSPAALRRQMR